MTDNMIIDHDAAYTLQRRQEVGQMKGYWNPCEPDAAPAITGRRNYELLRALRDLTSELRNGLISQDVKDKIYGSTQNINDQQERMPKASRTRDPCDGIRFGNIVESHYNTFDFMERGQKSRFPLLGVVVGIQGSGIPGDDLVYTINFDIIGIRDVQASFIVCKHKWKDCPFFKAYINLIDTKENKRWSYYPVKMVDRDFEKDSFIIKYKKDGEWKMMEEVYGHEFNFVNHNQGFNKKYACWVDKNTMSIRGGRISGRFEKCIPLHNYDESHTGNCEVWFPKQEKVRTIPKRFLFEDRKSARNRNRDECLSQREVISYFDTKGNPI